MAASQQDRSSELLGVAWFWSAVALIVVTARIWCRVKYQRKVWWDDFWALNATLFSISMSTTGTIYAHAGGAKRVDTLDKAQIQYVTRLNWISQPFCIFGIVSGRIAVACIIKRLQAPHKIRTIFLWTISIILFLWGAAETTMIFVQCRPVYLLWNPTSDPSGHCWAPSIVTDGAIAISSYMAFLDLLLAAVAVHMIWQLQMDLKRKVVICMLLSTGVFAFICAVIKITYLSNDSVRDDLTWATVDLFIWNACEVNVVVIATCVPTLVPLFHVLAGHRDAAYYRQDKKYNPQAGYPKNQAFKLEDMHKSRQPFQNTYIYEDAASTRQFFDHEQTYIPTISANQPDSLKVQPENGQNITVKKDISVSNGSRVQSGDSKAR